MVRHCNTYYVTIHNIRIANAINNKYLKFIKLAFPTSLEKNRPMETQGVQESRKTLHEYEDDNAEDSKRGEDDEEEDGTLPCFLLQCCPQDHYPEYLRQFCNECSVMIMMTVQIQIMILK